MVQSLKYGGGIWLEAEISAILRENPDWNTYFNGSRLVPVPLHRSKLLRRGYNQASVIARAIQRVVPGTELSPLLERIRRTPSQTFLSREQRRKNMRGAFTCEVEPCRNERIVLIDDVLTTSATLDAAAAALREAGWVHISAFTLAHG